MTLTEFLLARIAEDEADAATCVRLAADVGSLASWVEMGDVYSDAAIALGRRFNPARVLAECEAKRRIVEHAEAWAQTLHRRGGHFSEEGETCYRMAMRWVVEHLALPYADHPDYRQEWAL